MKKFASSIPSGITAAVAILLLCSTVEAIADSQTGKIVRLVSGPGKFNGCMVKLDTSVVGSGCTGSWVSLDCDGAVGSAEAGKRAYASAMLAYALEKQVTVFFSSNISTPVGNYCVANRIDVF